MNKQSQNISHMTDSLERGMLEQELRAMAQREAAAALARGVRYVFVKIRALWAGVRQARSNGLRSA